MLTVRVRVCLFSVLLWSCSMTLAPNAWPRAQCFMSSKPWGSFHWVLLVLVFQ